MPKTELKSQLGIKSGSFEAEISPAELSLFCKSIGATPGEEAPPTYFTLLRRGEFKLIDQLGIQLSQVLHAEQEYFYEAPVMAGDRLSFETELVQVLEKKLKSGGSQFFLGFETRFKSLKFNPGKNLGSSRSLIIYRSGTEGVPHD